MGYKIVFNRVALKALQKINDTDLKKIKIAIEKLADNPRPSGCKKLKNREGYRIRQGNYRIIYTIDDKVLTIQVLAIGDRKEIYGKLK